MSKICAIVVTYNRLELLKMTIERLLNQTRKLDEIIIINNASTDGTKEFLDGMKDKVTVKTLSKNLGGAGGFSEGIKFAYEKGHDYFWIMDDDTIAESNSLQVLEEALNRSDMVITTGGLGPTNDDLTKETACKFFNMDLELHQESLKALEEYFFKMGRKITESNYKQVYFHFAEGHNQKILYGLVPYKNLFEFSDVS